LSGIPYPALRLLATAGPSDDSLDPGHTVGAAEQVFKARGG
jgi:hypothetical protein